MPKGVKFDNGKAPYHLLGPFFGILDEVALILGFGANKYSPNNWMEVEDGENRYLSAAMRHISSHFQGEYFDEESGYYHLSHGIVNLMMALWHHQKNG